MSELKLQQCRLDGRYDVQDCLGRGSYSEVYVARDMAAAEGAPRTVVIKALNTSLQGVPDPELERTLIENFRNEAVALDRVRHPNIISRLGHGTAIDLQGRTFHYLVVEYLPGGDLQARIRNRPVPLDGALFYLEQVCNGLAHAHKHGVIHRDIKPQNLLLTADQHTVKIADFGVAKIEAGEGTITRVGTDVYAAPEHHPLGTTAPLDTASLTRRVSMLTPAADIYSLAKTTYMILTGEAPRRFSNKPITELPADFAGRAWSRYVLTVLEKATQTNPAKRHQTVEEFWRDIKDATMAQTRPLGMDAGGGDDSNAKPGGRDLATPPPPAPTFDRESRAPDNTARHRIVVPIARAGSAASLVAATPSTAEFPAPRARESRPPTRDKEAPNYPTGYESRLSSGARKWLVAFVLLLCFSGMLFATYKYVSNMRRSGGGGQQQSGGAVGNNSSPIGREFVTTTDVYLRNGPDRSFADIGKAERNSRVRVLQVSGKWYQVQVVERGRPKAASSGEQGWAHSANLKSL